MASFLAKNSATSAASQLLKGATKNAVKTNNNQQQSNIAQLLRSNQNYSYHPVQQPNPYLGTLDERIKNAPNDNERRRLIQENLSLGSLPGRVQSADIPGSVVKYANAAKTEATRRVNNFLQSNADFARSNAAVPGQSFAETLRKSNPFNFISNIWKQGDNLTGGVGTAELNIVKKPFTTAYEAGRDVYNAPTLGEGALRAGLGLAKTGWETAKVGVPFLRGGLVAPELYGKAIQNNVPEELQPAANIGLMAHTLASSPYKGATAGAFGLDLGANEASRRFTGKTLAENAAQIQNPYLRDFATLAANAGPALIGAGAGSRLDNFLKPKLQQTAEVLGYKSEDGQPVPIKKIVPQDFRSDKLQLNEPQTTDLHTIQSKLGLSTREVRSFEEMAQMAHQYDAQPEKLLSGNKRITDAEVIALKNLVSQNSEFIAKNEGKVFGTENENAIHQQKLEAAQVQVNQALRKLIKGGTEAGRAVVAYKQLANKNMDPTFWYMQAQKVLGSKDITPEMQHTINELASNQDRIGLAMYVSNLRQPSFAEKFITTWKAGLLTSPTTHLANVGGNTVMGATDLAAKGLSTILDSAASMITGKRTMSVSPLDYIKGLGTGATKAVTYLKTGIDADQVLNRFELPKVSVFKGDTLGSKALRGYTEGVFKTLGAEDQIFKTAALKESLASQARTIALNENLGGKALRERTAELAAKPTEEMALQAVADAEYTTFNNKNVLADMIGAMKARGYNSKNIAGRASATALDFLAPFVKTPTNIAARLADFSPLGLVKTLVRQVNPATRGQKSLVEDLGRSITGSGILALGMALGQQGMVTGAVPTNQKDRDQFYAEGKQANSIKIGDNWYQLNRIAPIGNLLAVGSQINDMGKTQDGLDLVGSSVGAGIKNITDQTFLQGVSGGLNVLTDPQANFNKFASQSASSLVPSLVARFAKALDPTMRNPKGPLQTLESRLPGLSQLVPARLDVFGNETPQPTGLQALFDPFNTRTSINEPVLKEAHSVGVSIGLPSNRMFNDTLTPEEFNEYQKVQGGVLKETLSSLTDSPEYQKLPDTKKTKAFEDAISKVQARVKDAVYPALIIHRYQLPEDSNPAVLREVMNRLNKQDLFSSMSQQDQAQVLREILSSASELPQSNP